MTLPSNISTTEPAAIPSDPFACLTPATAQASESACFDSVFSSQAENATVPAMADPATSCVQPMPLVGGVPLLYPSMAYMNTPAVCSAPVAKEAIPAEIAEGDVQGDTGETPVTTDADALPVSDEVLAYQLIAGQWVQQPQNASPVAKESPCVSVAGGQHGKQMAEISALTTPTDTEHSHAYVLSANIQAQQSGRKHAEPSAALSTTSTAITPNAETKTPAAPAVLAEKRQPFAGLRPTSASSPEAGAVLAKTQNLPTETVSVVEAGKQIKNELAATGIRPVSDTPEKIAAPRDSRRVESVSGVNSLNDGQEKKILSVDGKNLKTTTDHVGTRGANREVSMSYSVANKPVSPEFMTTQAVVNSAGIQSGTTTQVAETTTPITVQAPRLVEEIRAIADRISVIDRNSVEVRFDFSDSERLSVRVEYRDGTVHTTFRTDSSQLRDVISHEWQAQAAAAEQRSYRVADPVFNSPDTKQQNFSSLEDGSGRHRTFDQPSQSGQSSFTGSGRRAGSSPSTAASTTPAVRTETSRHLHTFA